MDLAGLTGASCRVVSLRSEEDKFSRECLPKFGCRCTRSSD